MLEDENLQYLTDFYNRSLQGEPFDDIFAGDFYTLPNKLPHCPIANARPLLNFTTVWKILSGIINCTALHTHTWFLAAEARG